MPSDVGKRKCFVIMPFSATSEKHTGQYWTAFFRDFIQPALEIHGYHAFLSEDQPHNIAKDVVQCLATCDLVLAVLTDANPNVWYELGIRHSLRQGTIMIIEKGTRLPFDVHNYGAVFYDDNDHAAFISDLERHLKKAEHGRKDSPVADFLNNEVALIVNIAIGRLKESVECILDNREAGRETVLQLLAVKQSLWLTRGQVSVVEKGIILLHECPELQGRRADGSWQDIMKRSLYPEMQDTRNGLRITELRSHTHRVTAIAYETLSRPDWLVIAEAHYFQAQPTPY